VTDSREDIEEEAGEQEDAEEVVKPSKLVMRPTIVLIAIAFLLFVWYVAAGRVAPWSSEAYVQAWVIPITPNVAGRVVEVNVSQDQRVSGGKLLAVIDPEPYEITVSRAEAALDLALQGIGADSAAVSRAQAEVVEARVKLEEQTMRYKRFESVAEKGAISEAELDRARAERDTARAELASANAELARAKQELGPEGEENPAVRDALGALRQARIDVTDTQIRAPSDGGITNLSIDEGYYANVGVPIMTFVSFTDVWVQANLRENSVANVKPGDKVELILETTPGRVFKGTVFSSGFAVQQPSGAEVGQATVIRGSTGWLRDAQRFPVVIYFEQDTFPQGIRLVGGQASVQIYTEDSNWLLNGLGIIWVRLMSLLSYVY